MRLLCLLRYLWCFFFTSFATRRALHSFPTRRSSDLFFVAAEFAMVRVRATRIEALAAEGRWQARLAARLHRRPSAARASRSEEHTSELQSRQYLVCRLPLEKKKTNSAAQTNT